MAPNELLQWLQTARTLAREAGRTIRALRHPASFSSEGLTVESKSTCSELVTSADLASQRLIFSGLAKQYPSHCLIGEEGSANNIVLTDKPTWIVDAIDGTTNYVHGLSDVAISIAVAVSKEPVVGVVYNPFRNELFHAVEGHGAFLNDIPIRVSQCNSLKNALVLSEWGYDRTEIGVQKMLAANERLMRRNLRGIRQLGSGSLYMCYVAMARADAVYCGVAEEAWHMWDYAAASLIAKEAGASLCTFAGKPFHITDESMVCSTPGIVEELVATVMGEDTIDKV